MTRVSGAEVSPQAISTHEDARAQIEDGIQSKHKQHHNFHGAHSHASEKERLKKLLAEVERLQGKKLSDDDTEDQQVKDDLHKMMRSHVRSSISSLKNQYGIDDEQLDHVDSLVDADNTLATQGDLVLSGGISVLYLFMNLLSDLAQYKYVEMQQKAKVSRDSQNMANRVQEQIAALSKQSNPDTATADLDPEVIKYMRDNDIKIDGKTIDDYLGIKGNSAIATDKTITATDKPDTSGGPHFPTTWTAKQYAADGKTVTGSFQIYKKGGKYYRWDSATQTGTQVEAYSDGKSVFVAQNGDSSPYYLDANDSKQAMSIQDSPMNEGKTWAMHQYYPDWNHQISTIYIFKENERYYTWDPATRTARLTNMEQNGEKLFLRPGSGDPRQNVFYWMNADDSISALQSYDSPVKLDGNAPQPVQKLASTPNYTHTYSAARQLNKGEFDAVKSALENASNRASDFVSQSQLQLQKVMQTYNVTVSLINSMQTMLEEMNKSIAQNVR